MSGRTAKALAETAGLLRGPQRVFPLVFTLSRDLVRSKFAQRNLYSYTSVTRPTEDALRAVIGWILRAQRADGGVPAYYSLLRGYSGSYPEVTGYIVPTLYDFAELTGDSAARIAAQRATEWLLRLQMSSGAFPAGFEHEQAKPSIFNTGQILQGLVRAYVETGESRTREAALAAGDWLASVQQRDGSWSGEGAYLGVSHAYYSMVAWALAELGERVQSAPHAAAARRHLDWTLRLMQPDGWIEGLNLQSYPMYLHFIAYAIQGVLECGILQKRDDAVEAAARSAWRLLRRFEIDKRLFGSYRSGFAGDSRAACLTGNAQMSCVWLRLFERTGDLRYLNAALKMNELLKSLLPLGGNSGAVGGVAGSWPIWGSYQPLRYISWGCKFFADALLLELRMKAAYEASTCAS